MMKNREKKKEDEKINNDLTFNHVLLSGALVSITWITLMSTGRLIIVDKRLFYTNF